MDKNNMEPIDKINSMTFKMSQGNSSFGLLFPCAAINSGMVTAIETIQPTIQAIEK